MRRTVGVLCVLWLAVGPISATGQELTLHQVTTLWFQGVLNDTPREKIPHCQVDTVKIHHEAVDALAHAPFTLLTLPGVVPLTRVSWLSIPLAIFEVGQECRAAVTFLVCDDKVEFIRDPQRGSSTLHCPSRRYLEFRMFASSPREFQAKLTEVMQVLSADLSSTWRKVNP